MTQCHSNIQVSVRGGIPLTFHEPAGASILNSKLFLSDAPGKLGPTSLDAFLSVNTCLLTECVHLKWPQNNENHWLPTYSSLDSVKCVMGYTQRFTTTEHKVAPRSAWVQSLWSRLWVFSLCAVFWHVYQLVDMLGCCSFFVFTPQT